MTRLWASRTIGLHPGVAVYLAVDRPGFSGTNYALTLIEMNYCAPTNCKRKAEHEKGRVFHSDA